MKDNVVDFPTHVHAVRAGDLLGQAKAAVVGSYDQQLAFKIRLCDERIDAYQNMAHYQRAAEEIARRDGFRQSLEMYKLWGMG